MAGSSGGGSTASGIPEYLSGNHILWLNHNVPDVPDFSMVDLMNAAWAIGGNPYEITNVHIPTIELNYMKDHGTASLNYLTNLSDILDSLCDPDCASSDDLISLRECIDGVIPFIDRVDDLINSAQELVTNLDHLMDWEVAIMTARTVIDGTIITDEFVNADIQSFADILDESIDSNVLPRFRAGMRNVNAVHSSAFSIGHAIIESARNRDVAKYATGLRLNLNEQRNRMIMESVELMLRNLYDKINVLIKAADVAINGAKIRSLLCDLKDNLLKIKNINNLYSTEFVKTHALVRNAQVEIRKFAADLHRIEMIALTDHAANNIRHEESKARWPLDVYQHGANLLAAVSGGTVPIPRTPSTFQNALGGALSGGALGGMLTENNSSGMGIGAVIGALGSIM